MTTLLQQLQMSFDAENTTAESLERGEQQRADPLQIQQQQQQQLQQQLERDTLQLRSQREREAYQAQQQQQQQQHQQIDRDTLQLQQQMDLDGLQLHHQQRDQDPLQQLHQQQRDRDPLQLHQQQRDPLQLHQQHGDPMQLHPRDRDPAQLHQQQRDHDSLQPHQQPRDRDPMQLHQQQRDHDSLQLHQQQRDSHQLHQHQRDPLQLHRQQRESMQLQQRRERDQLQINQREREQLQHREKMQMYQREHIAQLQSINNMLLDLPAANKTSCPAQTPRGHDNSHAQSLKGSNDGDMSMYDLFGLGLTRGSLMDSQSSIGSSSNWLNHGQNHGHNSPHLNYPQYDEGHGYNQNFWTGDMMPGTPNSATTPGTPSTPGSVYSNPYTYSNGGNTSGGYSTPSPTNRSHYNLGSPSSPGFPPYYGRPIRGSPAYSDCSSPTVEYPTMLGFGGSRSNSPADSETSGYSSMDGSMSDIIARNCLSLNSSGHSCYPSTMNPYMSPEMLFAIKKIQQRQRSNMRHHHCCSSGNKCLPVNKSPPNITEPNMSLDRAAKCHRNAAALCEAPCTWVGELPERTPKPSGYSTKVFLGGVPWDVTESLLISTFKQFGKIRVEWPGKEDSQPKGYAYIILESEKQVKSLLSCCSHKFGDDKNWYYRITPKRSKPKDVQVIPWHISESNYSKSSSQKLDAEKTVFVGALHGMMTAEGLAKVMNDLFDEVIYAGIDTDKNKYPIGSARVTFSNKRSYKKACATAFVEIKTEKFTKKIQIDPYIEDSVCSGCAVAHGPYFCREPICSRYFCRNCWHWQHALEPMSHHQPMSRGFKCTSLVPMGYKSHAGKLRELSG